MREKQIGDLRLWWTWCDNTGHHTKHYRVDSLADAFMMINALASADLGDDNVSWNAWGIEIYTMNEFDDWYFEDMYNDDGEEINDILHNIEHGHNMTRDNFVDILKKNDCGWFNFDYIKGGEVKLY